MKHRYLIIIAFIFCDSFISFSQNVSDSVPIAYPSWEKLSVQFGGFVTSNSSNIRFGSKDYGVGLDINLEEALGLNVTSYTGRASLHYRFSENLKHAGSFGYYQIFRKATKDLETEITIGGIVISPGSMVETIFNISILQFNYEYSIYMDERVGIALSAGLFMMPTNFTIDAEGNKSEQKQFVAPLPAIGIRTAFKITPKLSLLNSVDVFYMNLDSFEGTMLDVNFSFEYQPWKHVALGAGYNGFDFNFSAVGDGVFGGDFEGEVGYEYSGLIIFGKLLF